MPLPFVTAVVVAVPLANVPLAPVLGAVKVTVTLGMGVEFESVTLTASAVANGVPMVVDCPLPAETATALGAPTPVPASEAVLVPAPLVLVTVSVPVRWPAVEGVKITPMLQLPPPLASVPPATQVVEAPESMAKSLLPALIEYWMPVRSGPPVASLGLVSVKMASAEEVVFAWAPKSLYRGERAAAGPVLEVPVPLR